MVGDYTCVLRRKVSDTLVEYHALEADVVLQGAFRGMEIEDIDARVAELERAGELSKGSGRR